MRPLTAVAFLVLASFTAGAADDPKDAAKKLEGIYEMVEVLVDGKPDGKKKERVQSFVIKDGAMRVNTGKNDEVTKFTLDPSKKPAHIDILVGPDGATARPGIYEVRETDNGLELTIAFTTLAPNGERPKDFKGEGKGEAVMKLLRRKAK